MTQKNIRKYLSRISTKSSKSLTKEYLDNLHEHHLLNVPFENLDIHYKVPISLDPINIYKKIVENKRGGFCYELNGLFHLLLTSLGFKAELISCRVYTEGDNYSPEFDHMAILVHFENEIFLADVGFGNFIITVLPLIYNTEINDRSGTYIFEELKEEKYIRLSKFKDDTMSPEYIFKTKPRRLEEFTKMCVFHQTSKESHISKNRMISKALENGRITLTDSFLTLTNENGKTKEKINTDNFEGYLFNYFDIDLRGK